MPVNAFRKAFHRPHVDLSSEGIPPPLGEKVHPAWIVLAGAGAWYIIREAIEWAILIAHIVTHGLSR